MLVEAEGVVVEVQASARPSPPVAGAPGDAQSVAGVGYADFGRPLVESSLQS